MKGFLKAGGFIAVVLVLFLALDLALAASGWVGDSGYFWLDDYELTRRDHPEKVWARVIFGSSELYSGYREDLSESGFVDLGMDYGVITDLVTMLRRGVVEIDEELVLALNWCALCDVLDTNPTYEWHREWYEPYCWFERDRLGAFLRDEWNALLGAGEPRERLFLTQEKERYVGAMTVAELEARMEKLHGLFWVGGVADYAENLEALGELFELCAERGIRVRALWLPENGAVPSDPVNDAVRELARERCAEYGVELYDMTHMLPDECFYDTGHFSYDVGDVVFTEVLDKWLLS